MSSATKKNQLRLIVIPVELKVEPYEAFYNGSHDLKKLNELTGNGGIESYPLQNDYSIALYVNEHGMLDNLPINQHMKRHFGVTVYGQAILTRVNDDDGEQVSVDNPVAEWVDIITKAI